jgi:hypothetical protein
MYRPSTFFRSFFFFTFWIEPEERETMRAGAQMALAAFTRCTSPELARNYTVT